MPTKVPTQEAAVGVDDDDIIDLLEVVKPGKATVSDDEESMDDFSADLDSMLENLEKKERAESAAGRPFPDPTPVDHEVDLNETLTLSNMNDLDSLLESLGASPVANGPGAAAPRGPGEVSDDLDTLTPDMADLINPPKGAVQGKSPKGADQAKASALPNLADPDDLASLAGLGDSVHLSSAPKGGVAVEIDDELFDLGITLGSGTASGANLAEAADAVPAMADTEDEEVLDLSAELIADDPLLDPLLAPMLDKADLFAEDVAPDGTLPELSLPEIAAPEIDVPEIADLEIAAPEIETPEITTPEIEAPEITAPEIETPEITTPEIEAPEMDVLSLPDDEQLVMDLDFGSGEVLDATATMAQSTRARKEIEVDVDDLPEGFKGGMAEAGPVAKAVPDSAEAPKAFISREEEQVVDLGAQRVPVQNSSAAPTSTIDEDLNELDALLDDMLTTTLVPDMSKESSSQDYDEQSENRDLIDVPDSHALILRLENLENTLEYQARQQLIAEDGFAAFGPRVEALEKYFTDGGALASLEPRIAILETAFVEGETASLEPRVADLETTLTESGVYSFEARISAMENLLAEQQKRIEAMETTMEKMVATAAAKIIREEIGALLKSL